MEKLMTSCCPASRNLLKYLDKWKKSPQLDIDLGYELECFLAQFEQRNYDPDNLNASDFAEVAIFVQSYATIYDKKVDLLLKSLLQLHKELCDISSKPEEEHPQEVQPGTSQQENVPPVEQVVVQNPIEDPNQKGKKKKKEKEQPKKNEIVLKDAHVELNRLTPEEINTLTEEMKAKDAFTEKEMQEIGELWKMMNKIEKHKIENILNNLDENDGNDELWEKLENKKKQIENKMKNQNPNTTDISMNDSGIYSNYSQDLNSTLNQSDIFNESIISQGDIEKVLNSTTSQEGLTEPQNIENNLLDSVLNPELAQNQEAMPMDSSENPNDDENPIAETQDQNPTVINAGEMLTTGIKDDSFEVSDNHFDDSVSDISNIDEDFVKAKIEALKEVRVRLKRLSEDELFEKSEVYRKKAKKIYEEENKACLNCTGCTTLKHICSLDNVKSEAKKKEEDMKVEKRSLGKRGIEPDENQLSKKRIRLSKNRITAQKKDFDSFYDECYKNLKWIDDKLTVDNQILSKIFKQTKKDQKSDINSNDIYEEGDHTNEKTTEINSNENEDFTNNMDYEDETIEMDPELSAESEQNNEITAKSDKNDENNIKSAEQDLETTKVCHEVLSSLIDEVSNLDKTSEGINIRFSQESGYSEDFFTENDFDTLNQTQFEKELNNLSCQNKDILGLEKSNPMLTNLNDTCWSPCHLPHTPAHSEDSGRFSSAACHSDIEGEHLNRSIHHDSGVEMSHQSEDEDDNNSDIMPFKNLDPKSLTFYKRKCESLLEQRERDQKVREWQKFLKEKEASKIKLPEFHIDEYETKILSVLPEESTKMVTFNSVVENKSAEEVARFFAATLQLAYMNNVKISDDHLKADGTNDSFKLSLISREKYYENIELSDSFMENLSKKPFLTSTPFKAPKPKFKKSNKF